MSAGSPTPRCNAIRVPSGDHAGPRRWTGPPGSGAGRWRHPHPSRRSHSPARTIVMNDARGVRREFPRGPYTRLDLSAGSGACGGRRCECVVLGLFGGAALGAAVGFIPVQSQGGPKQCGDNLCELIYAFTIPGGALVGTIVGVIVGAEHWHRVDLPVRVGFTPGAPVGGRSDCRHISERPLLPARPPTPAPPATDAGVDAAARS